MINNFKDYNKIIITFVCLCLVAGFFGVQLGVLIKNSVAYADYEQGYLNNPQSLVNFNQLFNNNLLRTTPYYNIDLSKIDLGTYHVEGTNTNWDAFIGFNATSENLNLIANHKYYIRSNCTQNNVDIQLGRIDQTIYFNLERNNDAIYIPISDISCLFGFKIWVNVYYNFNVQPTLIDLTSMFGVGNEPDLLQCRDIFVSDYYVYDTGSVVSFGGFNAYNEGVNDTLTSLGFYSLNLSAMTSCYIDSSLNNSNAFVDRFYDASETSYSYYVRARGYLSVPFNNVAKSGTIINFKYYDPGQGGSGMYLWVGVYYNNSFYPIMFIGDLTGKDVQFTTPVDTTCLMFAESQERDYFVFSDSAYWLGDFSVDNAQINFDTLIASAKLNAYAEKDEYYNRYYGVNGSGYRTIYDSGYTAGYNASIDDVASQVYTFPQFIGALFDVPVRVITSLLDFDVFGFNLKNFAFSIITIALIFAIIRLILQKTGDKD